MVDDNGKQTHRRRRGGASPPQTASRPSAAASCTAPPVAVSFWCVRVCVVVVVVGDVGGSRTIGRSTVPHTNTHTHRLNRETQSLTYPDDLRPLPRAVVPLGLHPEPQAHGGAHHEPRARADAQHEGLALLVVIVVWVVGSRECGGRV